MGVNSTKIGKALSFHRSSVGSNQSIDIRLQIVIAKIQQSLPEMKRDGSNVLGSLWADLMYSDNSTSRFGTVLPQSEFIPTLAKQLQLSPAEVTADFEEIRKCSECFKS